MLNISSLHFSNYLSEWTHRSFVKCIVGINKPKRLECCSVVCFFFLGLFASNLQTIIGMRWTLRYNPDPGHEFSVFLAKFSNTYWFVYVCMMSHVVSPHSIMSYCFRIFRASIRRYVNALLFRRLGRKHTVSSIILLLCSRFVVIYFVLKFNMNTSIFFIIWSL